MSKGFSKVKKFVCVTINKGHCQENEGVGLDLHASLFSRGQFYTGMSRGAQIQQTPFWTKSPRGSRGQIVKISTKNLILSFFAL